MIVGKVVGSVVSTRKSEKLIGQKFMIVEPVHHMKIRTQPDCCDRHDRRGESESMYWWHKVAQHESAAAKKQHLLMRR